MRIWRFYFYYEKGNTQIIKLPRKLSKLDEVRIRQYLAGTHHVHGNPGKRKPKTPLLTVEEINTMITDMGKEDSPHDIS